MGIPCPSSSHFIRSKFHSFHTHTYQSHPGALPLSLQSLPQNPRPSIRIPLQNEHAKVRHRDTRIRHFASSVSKFTIRASAKEEQVVKSSSKVILVCSAITVVLAIANRVLYKLALVPMKEYPFMLAQINTFGYVAIYFAILYVRYQAGIVTDEMMALPKVRFMVIGILEALGVVAGMSAGAMLPGPAIPILSQTFLLWQLAFSTLILGRRYAFNRIAGCFLVAAGVIVAVVRYSNAPHTVVESFDALQSYVFPDNSGSDSGQMLSGTGFVWPTLMIASSAFLAGASVVKESVFIDATTRLKGKLLDIFVVNSFGSGFQVNLLWHAKIIDTYVFLRQLNLLGTSPSLLALFVLLFLPLLSNLKGIPFSELPMYLKDGAGCFFNIGTNISGCNGAPLLPLLYIFTNIAFNISLLNLVKISSAVVSSLAAMLSVPVSIYILALPLPYMPEGVSLSPFFLLGSLILVMGLVLYNLPQPFKQKNDIV
ncbi:hypothetical protein RJ639_031389 [Escallonia herrerae]|uniref:Uncharacterized protein n=1 Tax=Escallonia herrerae TaxID=1293975 RepID=A0AA89BEM0_9ASTE|nr:hypothetical protein RJ639_031389 [Escallonia herrerae]